uniref:Pol polyprotein n=1 Tax=Cajanus cajan TaxID=3821 RepID=A0A151U469_CAJCA|nr:Pol polyprotein [Cajanus cajan]
MVEQLSGTYQTKDTLLQRYFHVASQQISSFEEFTIHHVPREQNARASLLSKLASTKRPGQHRTIIQETLNSPSLDDKVVNTSDSEDQGWMTGIWNYLKEGILSEDKDKARKMRVRSAKFIIVGDELFKCDISTPLLKCLIEPQATYVIEEIHRGICGMHSDTRSMATRVLQAGYYAKGQLKFLLVAIDYFTKWIEACPLAKITAENVQRFTWKNIICRFGIPHSLVTDNGRQFIAQSFKDFLRELRVKHIPTSVEHPQTNGQAEAANKVILRKLKKWLRCAKGQWVDEIPSIL